VPLLSGMRGRIPGVQLVEEWNHAGGHAVQARGNAKRGALIAAIMRCGVELGTNVCAGLR
jgi:hypothetical protein